MYMCIEPLVMMTYKEPCFPVITLPRINLYPWILQDFLGIMFSINMLKVLRLPSLRICTILLSALFFYDIFFVFITPLFMSGKSVMVEVATGHSSDEQLPMVLRVPHLSTTPSRVCYMQTYSLLVGVPRKRTLIF